MQPASEKCGYLEELSCKEDSLKDNRFCFNQNQDMKRLKKNEKYQQRLLCLKVLINSRN